MVDRRCLDTDTGTTHQLDSHHAQWRQPLRAEAIGETHTESLTIR